MLKGNDIGVQHASATPIYKLAEQRKRRQFLLEKSFEYITTVKDLIPQILHLLKDDDWGVRQAAATTIRKLSEQRKSSNSLPLPTGLISMSSRIP